MTGLDERIATEALALVGVPFRLHGHAVETGLDCVGLALLAARRAGAAVKPPPGYHLRGMTGVRAMRFLAGAGLSSVSSALPGNLLLTRTGPMQLHIMILTAQGLVHAHAGLRRVVLMPCPSPWPVLGQWRFSSEGSD